MSIKKYTIDYASGEASAVFNIDCQMFTEEKARITLEFSPCYYNEGNDPIEEAVKLYSLKCFQITARTISDPISYCKKEFQYFEEFCNIDGSEGILLVKLEPFEFNENDINIKTEI